MMIVIGNSPRHNCTQHHNPASTAYRPKMIQTTCCEETRSLLSFTARFYSIENSITFKKHIKKCWSLSDDSQHWPKYIKVYLIIKNSVAFDGI
jgi:hypothetical protein